MVKLKDQRQEWFIAIINFDHGQRYKYTVYELFIPYICIVNVHMSYAINY